MSSTSQLSDLPQGVQLLGEACFHEDFSVEHTEGHLSDVDSLGVLLPTMIRSASSCGDSFGAGEFQGVVSLGEKRGLVISINDEKSCFRLFDGATIWSDLKDEKYERNWSQSGFPLFYNLDYIGQVFKSLGSVKWYGLRDNEDNRWSQEFLDDSLDTNAVESATMMTLQIDMLLKGQDLPRGRIRLDFENGQLWIWASVTDDYLMAYTERVDNRSDLSAIEQLGEAFLLGPLV
ncbi:hypothetical protein [Rubellicoccus peritrichatus]|uniref:Uncharacterized protein n=1 Tax=Rubellicoccus peritrichatus TaxID=3080537 RepID=A0AAQ3QXH4_9BACT|nr:hypothetical protein [Puniceicoccus sp. CR14]WOO42870.1 hypothetical protein RZN69_07180 [Puniceicoccus sp. CR14]